MNGGPSALELWREKLASFLAEEAIASDPEKRFQLRVQIREARQKIAELESQEKSGRVPGDLRSAGSQQKPNPRYPSSPPTEGFGPLDEIEGTLIVDTISWRASVLLTPPFQESPEISITQSSGRAAVDPEIEAVTPDKFTVKISSSDQAGEWKWIARGRFLDTKSVDGRSMTVTEITEGRLTLDTASWRASVFLRPPFLETPEITLVHSSGRAAADPKIESVTLDKFTVKASSSDQTGEWIWRARGLRRKSAAESPGLSRSSTDDNTVVQEIILLIHGIRDFAEWEHKISPILKEIPEKEVWPLSYGRFDAVRFWFPIWTRDGPVKKLLWRIRSARRERFATAKLSVIAHSFGTYAIGRILKENPDIRLHRLILCGAVLPTDFRWDQIQNRVETDIINDCGIKDVWPVQAQSTTFGYGPSGRFGFGTPGVRDRFHDFGHGGFFQEKFVRDFWLPWFRNDEFVNSKAPPPSEARWHLLTIIQIKWLVPILLTVAIFCYFFWSRSPGSQERARSLGQTECPWHMVDLSNGQPPKNLSILSEPLVHGDLEPAIEDDLKKWRSQAQDPTNSQVVYQALFTVENMPRSLSVRENVNARLVVYILDENGSRKETLHGATLGSSVDIRIDRTNAVEKFRLVAIVFPFDKETFNFLHYKEDEPCKVLQTDYP